MAIYEIIKSEMARAFMMGIWKTELTAVQRKTSASMVNRNGVESHDETRRMKKKAIPTGMQTRNSTSMTMRGLGS